jgi:predicted phosphoadenosine phosphosulfate sulfurtransferase
MAKQYLPINVYEAAKQRIEWTFDTFKNIYVSFSGGKDSSVMLHLVMDEAIKRNRKVGLLFIDWEVQFELTIEHVFHMFEIYKNKIIPCWVSLPLLTTNACSNFEPEWICWESGKDWVRQPPEIAITDYNYFSFYKYAMTFEEFVPEFAKWYSPGNLTACFVGIRAQESLHRYCTVASGRKQTLDDKQYTTWCGQGVYNIYPIYDWQTEDIWIYNGKFFKPYNKLYDLMNKAGLSIHKMRICEPYGDEQRKGLWLYHIVEPETWGKVVARVNGANNGALYANESGNVLGNRNVTKPPNHTWKSFAMLLLKSLPEKTKNHYENKIAVYLKWCYDHGYLNGIPDFVDGDTGQKDTPSWRRIVKVLLKNDYWCKGLSFSPTKSASYQNYLKIMKRRRQQWMIF